MRFQQAVILALSLVLGVNSLPTAELFRRIPRHLLEAEFRALLEPGFKSAIDDAIINLLNTTVRQIILEGSPDLGIPVLDPFYLEHADLNINVDNTVQLNGTLDQVEVKNISTFVIDNITANILLLKADFGFSVPKIEAKGNKYSLDGIIEGLLPVYGEGNFTITVEGLSLKGTVTLGSNNSFIYVKSFVLDINLTKATVDLEGLLGGGDLGELANEAVSKMIPELLEQLKPDFLPYVTEQVIELANGLLEGVTLQDILDLING